MAMRLTPQAEAKLRELAGVRLTVEPGGCCGTCYRFRLGGPVDGDRVVAPGLALSPEAAAVLQGALLDYGAGLKPPRFRVLRNPNTPVKCPCGRSFGRPFPGKSTPVCEAYRAMDWDRPPGEG